MFQVIEFDFGIGQWMSATTLLGREIQPLVDRDFPQFGKLDRSSTYAMDVEGNRPVRIGIMPDGRAGGVFWHTPN